MPKRVYTAAQKANRSKVNAAWRETNDRAAQRRQYYLDNKAKIAKRQAAYRLTVPIAHKRARRLRWESSTLQARRENYAAARITLPWRNSLNSSRARAKQAGIPFALTREWCIARWTGRCEVTGIEFVMSRGRHPYLYSPSLDRIDAKRGYVPDNCRFVIHAVNALKGAGTDADMLEIASAIVRVAISK